MLTAASTPGNADRGVSDLQARSLVTSNQMAQEEFASMGIAMWKGLLRFGLISISVKLYQAAQAEKLSFWQLHKTSGARLRHKLCTDTDRDLRMPAAADIAARRPCVLRLDDRRTWNPGMRRRS